MLRKLIKYDLIWNIRALIVFFIISIILSVLTRIVSNYTDAIMGEIIYKILTGCTIAAFVNTIINAAIRIWVRFRQNHYKDEAYLMHTLPATKGQLYDSKIISALISTLIAVVVIVACFFIAFWNNDIYQYFHNLVEYGNMGFILGGMFASVLLEIIYIVVVGLFGIVVGHRQNNGRVLISVIVSMGLYFILQSILLGVIYCIGFFDDGVKAMFSNNPDNSLSFDSYRTLIIATDISYLVLNVSLYLAGKKLFAKGVNVE